MKIQPWFSATGLNKCVFAVKYVLWIIFYFEKSDLQQASFRGAPYLDVLVAKWQRGGGLVSFWARHLEVFGLDDWCLAFIEEGVLSTVGGAIRRSGHMIHAQWQRRKLSHKVQLQEEHMQFGKKMNSIGQLSVSCGRKEPTNSEQNPAFLIINCMT